jgi:hypothetical protein
MRANPRSATWRAWRIARTCREIEIASTTSSAAIVATSIGRGSLPLPSVTLARQLGQFARRSPRSQSHRASRQ